MTNTAPTEASRSALLQESLHRAALHHQAGQLDVAEELYRAILELEPNHPDAHFNLGLLATQLQQPAAGLPHFQAALEANPVQEAYWLAYIDALIATGQFDTAQQVLALGSKHGLRGEAVERLTSRLEDAQPSRNRPRHPAIRQKTAKMPRPHEISTIVFLYQQGRHNEAEAQARKLTQIYPRCGDAWKLLGAAILEQGRSAAALEPMRQAAALLPGDALVHTNLGNAWRASGRLDAAIASHRRALKIDPACAEAHSNLGLALWEGGQVDAALTSYRHALQIRSDCAMTLNNLGAALLDLGQTVEAEAKLRRAAELKPDLSMALDNLAIALNRQGKSMDALQIACQSLRIRETQNTKKLFVDCIRNLQLKLVGADLRALLVQALSEPWGRPSDLTRACTFLVKHGAGTANSMARAVAAWPRRLPAPELFNSTELDGITADPLLHALLVASPIGDVEFEHFLTMMRHALLDAATSNEDKSGTLLDFCCALARQCFINEYVFDWTEDEAKRVGALRDAIVTAVDAGAPIPPLWLAIVANYFPLYSLPGAERLLARSWPPPVDAVLTLQVREPLEERALRSTIPRLTNIDDEVSLRVRDQYEENPYPRWVKTTPAPAGPQTIDEHLRQQFPLSPFLPLGKTSGIDILIAGCGTGQQSIEVAQRYRDSRILAVDLSLASLGYAHRKSLGQENISIEYAQADILQLGTLNRSFDVIMSSGVLHHLADPLAGLRVLLSLLRPNGIMLLGFYSEIARRNIVRARAYIASRAFGATADEIRRCRQELIDLDMKEDLGTTTKSGDFFSISACRDLLFHVQEHRMTLDGIADFLRVHDLRFLGFQDAGIVQAYRQRFSDDPAATNLAQWQVFERENPDTFFGMYQFWVQKAA